MLAADALQRPEEERLRELARGVVHARGDVEDEYDRRLGQRLGTACELPKAQVVVGERDRVRLDGSALHCFLDGAAAVQSRPGPTAMPCSRA